MVKREFPWNAILGKGGGNLKIIYKFKILGTFNAIYPNTSRKRNAMG